MSNSIYFSLNGKKYFVKQVITISDLLKYFNYNRSLLVLEHNNLICNKANWDKVYIKNTDKIEIVSIVGGG